jgi:hypothetical protein
VSDWQRADLRVELRFWLIVSTSAVREKAKPYVTPAEIWQTPAGSLNCGSQGESPEISEISVS